MKEIRLPDSILLQVILYSDVPSIKTLRLASSSIRNLIASYEKTIYSTVLRRLYSDYVVARFRPISCSEPSISSMIKIFNRMETANWLSGVFLEQYCISQRSDCCFPESPCYEHISAEDPRGDSVRAGMAIGWSVLWHLADLAKVIERGMRAYQLDGRCDSSTQYNLLATTELVIRNEWLDYTKCLDISERIEHCRISDWLFPSVFRNPSAYPEAWMEVQHKPNWYLYNLALAWAYMHEGPSFFKEAWSSEEANRRCAQRVAAEWNAKSPELQKLCIETSSDVSKAIRGRTHDELDSVEYDKQEEYYRLLEENEEHPELMIGTFRNILLPIIPTEIDVSRVAPLVNHPDDSTGSPRSSSSSNY